MIGWCNVVPVLRRVRLAVAVVALFAVGCSGIGVNASGAAGAATTTTAGLIDIGSGLEGPAGLAAAVASVGAPNVAALAEDADGRLWFGTADYTDSGSDGVYLSTGTGTAPIEVISGQHTVLGLLWHDGELFVASKERVDAYTGFNGTTFASTRNVVTFAAGVGEVNGIVISSDGRLRLGISSPCDSCTPTIAGGGSVVSFLPDGSDLRIDATGIRAPVGLAVVPGTSALLVTMNQRDDLDTKTPGDWLSSISAGQDWKQPACYGQGGTDCSGVPAPVATLDQHAAASGVAVVTGSLGPTIGTSAFVAEWTKGVVLRVDLTETAGTYSGSAVPFIEGITKPMPVLTWSTGGLLIGDWATGTIYEISTSEAA